MKRTLLKHSTKHTGWHANRRLRKFLQGSFIHSGTSLDGSTGFDSSSLLRRRMLSGLIGPLGLVDVDDEELPAQKASLAEASALLQRVRRWYTVSRLDRQNPNNPSCRWWYGPTSPTSLSLTPNLIFSR